MELEKKIDSSKEAEEKPSWITVYTDYGYGLVDSKKFVEQVKECQELHAQAQQPILEYFKAQHETLKQELVAKKLEQAKQAKPASSAVDAAGQESKLPKNDDVKPQSASEAEAEAEANEKKEAEAGIGDKLSDAEAETKKLLSQISLTAVQKASIRDIYTKIVCVKFRWGGKGFIQRRLVSQHITVNVKTLHGDRKTHSFTVSIFDKISKIHEKLCEADPDGIPEFSSPKFIYPQGKIRILELEDVIEKAQLKSGCTLVLMGVGAFCWDKNNMMSGIEIESNGLKAARVDCSDTNHRTVLSTCGISRGRLYWELTIQSLQNDLGVYMGIAKRSEAATLAQLKDTYGLLIPEHKKFSRKPEAGSYNLDQNKIAPPAKEGDVYGLLLEFESNGKASLTFFKNKLCMGKLHPDVPEGEYYPCVSLSQGKNTVLLNPRPMVPQKPYENMKLEE